MASVRIDATTQQEPSGWLPKPIGTVGGTAASPSNSIQMQPGIPVFSGGGISTVAVAVTSAVEFANPFFLYWAALEALLMLTRIGFVYYAPRHLGRAFETGAVALELVGAISVGIGAAAIVIDGSSLGWVLGWFSATAFAGEICARNFGSLKLIVVMIALGTVPAVLACLASSSESLQVAAALTIVYTVRISFSTLRLNGILTRTMRAERENDHRSRHDKLTGLLNRAGLEHEVERMRVHAGNALLTLFFIDLDHFKAVNDNHGHAAGDRLLRSVGDQLLEVAGAGDIVARIGGDEFVVITALDVVAPTGYGEALLTAVASAQSGHGVGGSITASIGAAATDRDGSSLAELLVAADLRLYEAKRAGGATYV